MQGDGELVSLFFVVFVVFDEDVRETVLETVADGRFGHEELADVVFVDLGDGVDFLVEEPLDAEVLFDAVDEAVFVQSVVLLGEDIELVVVFDSELAFDFDETPFQLAVGDLDVEAFGAL